MKTAVKSPASASSWRQAGYSSFQRFSFQHFSSTRSPLFPRNPHFPALRSVSLALSEASRRKQIPSSQRRELYRARTRYLRVSMTPVGKKTSMRGISWAATGPTTTLAAASFSCASGMPLRRPWQGCRQSPDHPPPKQAANETKPANTASRRQPGHRPFQPPSPQPPDRRRPARASSSTPRCSSL